jgi:hypothetical protein
LNNAELMYPIASKTRSARRTSHKFLLWIFMIL